MGAEARAGDERGRCRNISIDTALLALQGPASREVLQRIAKADLAPLKYYWLTQTIVHTEHAEVPCMVSRTGYTGELGYEIMVDRDLAPWVWDELLDGRDGRWESCLKAWRRGKACGPRRATC